jgi:ataxin-3
VASTYAAPPTKSYNYDDTGFFSISVLEKVSQLYQLAISPGLKLTAQALQVWDLTLVRWRGEAMKPYVDNPE